MVHDLRVTDPVAGTVPEGAHCCKLRSVAAWDVLAAVPGVATVPGSALAAWQCRRRPVLKATVVNQTVPENCCFGADHARQGHCWSAQRPARH